MNSLDIVVLIILAISLAVGALWGAVRSVFTIASVIAGFLISSNFYHMASEGPLQLTSHKEVNDIISFLAIFIFTSVLISFIGGHIAMIVKKSKLKAWDSLTGAAVGALAGLVVSCLIVYALLVFLPSDSKTFTKSHAFPYISRLSELASPIAPGFFEDEFQKKMGEFKAGPLMPKPPKPPAPPERPKAPEKPKAHNKGK